MKISCLSIFIVVLFEITFADFTIHILNPWREDTSAVRRDSLRLRGNSEVGYYPGSSMTAEGEGWFLYTYKELDKHGFTMEVVTWIGPEDWRGRVVYPFSLSVDSLFAPFAASTNELWIIITDTALAPQVYDIPPSSKVINIFNPWPDNSPQIIFGENPPLRMRSREDICGWYRYYYAGTTDGLSQIKFTDYFHTQIYTSLGMADGAPIDLRPYMTSQDTAYILPRPFPYGAPVVTNSFPGRTGECGYRKISGLFRDWKLDDISFFNNPSGMGGSGTSGMVLSNLSAPDYKPLINPDGNTKNAEQLETWYRTVTFPDGSDNDTCIDITMKKSDDGMWVFDSDWIGGFFMLDSFDNLNNIQYADAFKVMHNFHFTMELHLQFVYHEGAGLAFYFRGDDDVWVYVNGQLAIDLGGLHDRASDTLLLDEQKAALGLVDGEIYSMDMFYAERNPVGANFMIKTSMDLRNSDELYYKEILLGDGSYQYDIWQRVLTEGIGCGTTRLLDEEALAQVDFFLEGPQFADDSLVLLPPGLHFGGLSVDASKSRVVVDSAEITGLAPGEYRVTFRSTVNQDRSGYLVFTVTPRPHHLDILTDSITLDLKQDALIDSILISLEKDSIRLYAVVRDSAGNFLQSAVSAMWSSSNEDVVSVQGSLIDLSRSVVVKNDGGTAWIIVSADGLRPDSVRIVTVARPKYPIVSSAVMLDNNGDNVPDLLQIALSDTFATGQSLTRVEINYQGMLYNVLFDSCRIEERIIYAPFSSLTGADGRPSGNVTIVMDVDGEQESHTNSFTDGIGPSLLTAEVLENDGSEPDILFLRFSEQVFPATVRGDQLLLIRTGTADTIALNILQINHIENDSMITVLLSPSVNRPLAGDGLRLIPGSNGGKIAELNDLKPHNLNIPVTIGFRAGAASIMSASYKDVDADGILDVVTVCFKRAVQISEFDTIKIQWNSQGHLIEPGSFESVGDFCFDISLNGNVVNTTLPLTSGLMYIAIEFKSVPGVIRTSMVSDSAAPVLVSAVLYPGKFNVSGLRDPDTLVSTFSEDIQISGNYQFRLKNRYSDPYRFQAALLDNGYTFFVTAIEPDSISPRNFDSIWIDTAVELEDLQGNSQLNPLNRRVLLQVIEPEPEWVLRIGPNPVKISESVSRIRIIPGIPVETSRFLGRIIIHDAIGNQVVKTDLKFQNNYFEYEWNGCNKHGRRVGSGIYSVLGTIYSGSSIIWSTRMFIGVVR